LWRSFSSGLLQIAHSVRPGAAQDADAGWTRIGSKTAAEAKYRPIMTFP
jgi:hypothetical protein